VLRWSVVALAGYPVQGRLTTESGVPVSPSDRTAQGTIYFTPYNGNVVSLFTSSGWKAYAFTEKSLALTVTSGKNYDVFLYDNTGTLTLELSAAWTTDTARADALTTQDGVTVKSGATNKRWLGTIRASGSNTTEDSLAKRFVWSAYNQVARTMQAATEATNSWSYTTATWRQANANAANQLAYVAGGTHYAEAAVMGSSSNGSNTSRVVSVGVDSTSTPTTVMPFAGGGAATAVTVEHSIIFKVNLSAGYHFLAWLEYSEAVGTTTWYGDGGVAYIQSGMVGMIWN